MSAATHSYPLKRDPSQWDLRRYFIDELQDEHDQLLSSCQMKFQVVKESLYFEEYRICKRILEETPCKNGDTHFLNRKIKLLKTLKKDLDSLSYNSVRKRLVDSDEPATDAEKNDALRMRLTFELYCVRVGS